ncbi:hypothetical protein A2154_02900 [Candidatus Gottesmanbacteria bacterium RBG_16_43_7]|uniref:Flavodoxin-like domain-containing protein n=1 Tax=Candidatus Gottesmanbacteria bacterium RBG_16_43_7 TaxID=1798373 RepID=A0A1F5Z9R4_9BACT|nr:MAG: hypothetical protein A2154_02900 [Candidatus Gottesmanbacteria bacterium RBG_16_43_7]
MKALVVFATFSGSTQLAAKTVQESLSEHHLETVIKNVSQTTPGDLGQYDVVVLCSPSWDYNGQEGMLHEDYIPFMESAKGQFFSNVKFAVVGLGDSSYTKFCGAVAHLEKFIADLKGQLMVESLKIDGFFYDQGGNTQKVKTWTDQLAGKLQS